MNQLENEHFIEKKIWSDKFSQEVKRIIGEKFIIEDDKEDMEHNTDFLLVNTKHLRFSCRIRKFKYFKRFPNNFTIHLETNTNAKTEFEKVVEGWGDVFFYGFSNELENGIHAWAMIDLKVFRKHLFYKSLESQNNKRPFLDLERDKKTSPRSGYFLSFNYKDFPKSLVIDNSNLYLT